MTAAKPPVVAPNLDEIPRELRARRQWVVWRLLPPEPGKDKWQKVPFQTLQQKAASDNPATWTDFETAVETYRDHNFDGVGYVFTADDPFIGIDWDHSYSETEGITPDVLRWLHDLNTYCELSASGTGIHAIVKGHYPFDRGRKSGSVELYKERRFFTMSGRRFDTLPAEPRECQDALDRLAAYYFPAQPGGNGYKPDLGSITFDDAQIIERCRHAANGAKFQALWNGKWEGMTYPSQSEAEFALLGILKFWTQNEGQIERLMRASGLARAKWASRRGQDTYLSRSVSSSTSAGGETYSPGPAMLPIAHTTAAQPSEPDTEPEEEATRPRYILHWADEALGEIPPIDWVVDELFARGSVSLVVGNPGTKKTYSMLDCAACVAMGEPWIGRLVQQGTVLIIDEESGDRRLKRRLKKILRGHRLGMGVPIAHTSLELFNLLSSPADVQYINSIMAQLQPALVIIDALADVMPGGDENAVRDTHPVFQKLRTLAERHNCAVAVIHHAGKAGSYRGSSAIAGAVDLLLMVDSEQGSTIIVFKMEKPRDTEPQTFGAQILFDEAMGTVRLINYAVDPGQAQLSKSMQFVLDYLKEHRRRAPLEEIANAADICSPATARRAVYLLTDKKMVRRTDIGKQGEKATYELC
mgnify:CR=1 FL=1